MSNNSELLSVHELSKLKINRTDYTVDDENQTGALEQNYFEIKEDLVNEAVKSIDGISTVSVVSPLHMDSD